jgi:hypothetical protein
MEETVLVVFTYIRHDVIVFRPRAVKVDQGRFRERPNVLLEAELFMVHVRRRGSSDLEGFHVIARGFRQSGEHFQLGPACK